VDRRQLSAYAALALPLAFLGLPLYVYVPGVYAELPAIGLTLAGLVLFGARLLDLLTDPLIGLLADRWRSSLHPYAWLCAGALLLALGAWWLFDPPASAGALYLLLSVSLTYLGWSLMAVPYHAWGAELATPGTPQRTVAAWREAGMIAGAVVALLVAALAAREQALPLMGTVLIGLLPLALLGALSLPRHPVARPAQHPGLLAIWSGTDAAMRRLLLLHFVNALAAGVPATLFLLYAEQVLQLDAAGTGQLLLLYFLCGVAALPLWLRLAARIGELRAWRLAILVSALGFVPAAFLGAGDLPAFALVCVITGAALGADIALPAAEQARLSREQTRRQGASREASAFGLWGVAGKLALACAVGVSLPLLGMFEEGQARAAALPWLYALAPALVKLAAAMLLQRWLPLLQARNGGPEDAQNDQVAAAATGTADGWVRGHERE